MTRSNRNRYLWPLAVLALFSLTMTVWAEDARPAFAHAPLVIERADGKRLSYNVEVAVTRQQQEYGLMFQRDLKPTSGMIFTYDQPQTVAMWMKNTYIPLDMLFVDVSGKVSKIITNAEPLKLTVLNSDGPVMAVIELKGGEAAKDGIQTGNKVIYQSPITP